MSDKEEEVKTQVEKQEKQVEKKKVESLEAERDAQRQKSAQGNLIVSSRAAQGDGVRPAGRDGRWRPEKGEGERRRSAR